MCKQEYGKAKQVLSKLLAVHKKWKSCTYSDGILPVYKENEFVMDDYVFAKATYAESLMALGNFKEAIQEFEHTKAKIQKELIFENHLLYVNICS